MEYCDKIKEAEERASYWEFQATRQSDSSDYYRKELAKAHELLGRVIHQLSERGYSVNLTEYFPTNNFGRKRTVVNPSGKKGDTK